MTTRFLRRMVPACMLMAGAPISAPAPAADGAGAPAPYGIASRTTPAAYLRMPHSADGQIPRLLSQTGAFSNKAQTGDMTASA